MRLAVFYYSTRNSLHGPWYACLPLHIYTHKCTGCFAADRHFHQSNSNSNGKPKASESWYSLVSFWRVITTASGRTLLFDHIYRQNAWRLRKNVQDQFRTADNFLQKTHWPQLLSILRTLMLPPPIFKVSRFPRVVYTAISSDLVEGLNDKRWKNAVRDFFIKNVMLHNIGPINFYAISPRTRITHGFVNVNYWWFVIMRRMETISDFSRGNPILLNCSRHHTRDHSCWNSLYIIRMKYTYPVMKALTKLATIEATRARW